MRESEKVLVKTPTSVCRFGHHVEGVRLQRPRYQAVRTRGRFEGASCNPRTHALTGKMTSTFLKTRTRAPNDHPRRAHPAASNVPSTPQPCGPGWRAPRHTRPGAAQCAPPAPPPAFAVDVHPMVFTIAPRRLPALSSFCNGLLEKCASTCGNFLATLVVPYRRRFGSEEPWG